MLAQLHAHPGYQLKAGHLRSTRFHICHADFGQNLVHDRSTEVLCFCVLSRLKCVAILYLTIYGFAV